MPPVTTHYRRTGRRIRNGIVAFVLLAATSFGFGETSHPFAAFGLLGAILFLAGAVNLGALWLTFRRGEEGENLVARELCKLPEGFTVERNVVIPGAKVGDLDLVVSSPYKTFVLEVKNWASPVYCDGDRWWIERPNGSLRRVKSPTLQVKRASNAFRKGMRNPTVVEGLVVMTGGARMSLKSPSVPVVSLKTMNAHILTATVEELGEARMSA